MYVNAPRYLLRKRLVLRLLSGVEKGKILEVGCGAGDLCATLGKAGFRVRGIDSSKQAIELCHALHRDSCKEGTVEFVCESLADVRDTFDVVLMFEVLEHIKDDRKALSEVHRVLRPEGQLLLSVPAHSSLFGPSDLLAGHYRRYDRSALIGLLEEARFEVQTVWSYGVPLANVTERIRNCLYRNRAPQPKERATAEIGIERSVEAKWWFLCNDVFLYPFYLAQDMFLNSDLGMGYIVRARRIG